MTRRRVFAVVVDDEGRIERFLTRQELDELLARRASARATALAILVAVAIAGVAMVLGGT